MNTITDSLGTVVKVSDMIAVAATGYNHHPQIRVGEVRGFRFRRSNETETPDQIEVLWHHVSSLGAAHLVGDTSRIDATKKRFVVIAGTLEGRE